MEPNRNANPNMNASNNNPDVDPNPDPNDWRTLFPVEDRQRTVNAVLDAYKSRLFFPENEFSGDYLFKYKRSIVEFESAAFMEAANEKEYLWGICCRMDAIITKPLSATSSSNSKPSNCNDGKQHPGGAGGK
ncbi:mediator of RNA polymerase II transcription subunit 15a-like isoform X2 [Aristolochia californica]|uniref:mediator of RNA polymerase II transcription subunit 15a-like isoform X2 n=1 Tax=Aristolochia californica TaxID=171875 RepID=UPI0035D8473A